MWKEIQINRKMKREQRISDFQNNNHNISCTFIPVSSNSCGTTVVVGIAVALGPGGKRVHSACWLRVLFFIAGLFLNTDPFISEKKHSFPTPPIQNNNGGEYIVIQKYRKKTCPSNTSGIEGR